MNPPLMIHHILQRVLTAPCPGVHACPSNSPLQAAEKLDENLPLLERTVWELWELVPEAPRLWSELGSPFDGSMSRRIYCAKAERVLGCKVVLSCGESNEILVTHQFTIKNIGQ